jgi:triosephosphate isomerase
MNQIKDLVNINDKLKEFYETVKKHKIKNVICIDETSKCKSITKTKSLL